LWEWVKSAAAGIKDALVARLMAAKNRVIALAQLLWIGVQNRLTKLRARASQIVTKIRDFIVGKFKNIRDRILSLLSLARELASKARDWVGGLIQGVKDRVGDLVSAFKDMASQAARGFKNKFNELIPSSIGIDRVSISVPDILGGGSVGVGPASIDIPQLNTGGRIARDGLAMLHAGERVVPAAQVRERGPQPVGGGTTVQEININVAPMGDNPEATGNRIARQLQQELEDRGA
jgi:phage-related protein